VVHPYTKKGCEMDPRVIAERKAVAMARIESGLDELTRKFDFDQRVAGDIRKSYADPDLTDLRRVEGIADLIEGLIEGAGVRSKVSGIRKGKGVSS